MTVVGLARKLRNGLIPLIDIEYEFNWDTERWDIYTRLPNSTAIWTYHLSRFDSEPYLSGLRLEQITRTICAEFGLVYDGYNLTDVKPDPVTGDFTKMKEKLREAFPKLKDRKGCPACQYPNSSETVEHLIIHLNDVHKWSREAIAEWVDNG